MARTIGNRVAPVRFIVFMGVLIVAAPAAAWFMHHFAQDPLRAAAAKGLMLGFDVAALAFLIGCLPLLRIDDPATMRDHAEANDANRPMLLVITAIVSLAILAAVAAETIGGDGPGLKTKMLIVGTLLLAWLFGNTVYALHYAHMVALKKDGIDFPGAEPPGYADFVYFAFTLGMTFQTSDVNVTDKRIRNAVTFHCLAAFIFNLGILAFTINVLGG
jgi:uncharacterized membrane protein